MKMPEDAETTPDWYVNVDTAPVAGSAGHEPPRTRCKTRSLGELMASVINKIERGETPTVWTPADEPWGNLEFTPRSILTIGAPHNAGKTALVIDAIVKLLTRYPDLRIVFASNDMDPEAMTKRFMANVLGVSYTAIRNGIIEGTTATEAGGSMRELLRDRVTVVYRPFVMAELMDVASETGADIVVVDTLQATDLGQHHESQQRHVAAVMRALRALADTGPCVVATSALSRNGVAATRGRVGRTDVNPLDMGCFAHAHEVAAESDVLLLLLAEEGEQLSRGPDDHQEPVKIWLQAVKVREGVKSIVPLWFDGTTQRFSLRTLDENKTQSSKRNYPARRDSSGSGRKKSGNQAHGKRVKSNGLRWLD